MAFLAEHVDDEFSPAAISTAVTPQGRKLLGLRDRCANFAAAGKIKQVADKPARYRHAM
ncbi:MAG TPA: hypothetical protein VFY84_03965 [Jiangellales bacterium]|nr:hypothetical protein [Jiangellales bacterium]